MANIPVAGDPAILRERFAEANAEYERLASSLEALGVEIAALGQALDAAGVAGVARSGVELRVAPAEAEDGRPLLRAFLLGPFQLMMGQVKVSADMPGQAQTVLKYLISQRKRPVSREALLDLLWPDADPSTGLGRLRVVMHTLRKMLHQSCEVLMSTDLVVAHGNNVALNPELELWVDVEEFEKHWHMGWKLKRDGRVAEAMGHYEAAEGLYAGDYVEDEVYADWTLLKREALRDAYSTILTMLAGMSSEAGDDMGAIIWAQKLLAQDDCREDAYRHLIASHVRLGQEARAVRWYGLCERTLRRELGIEPGAETQGLMAAYGLNARVVSGVPG